MKNTLTLESRFKSWSHLLLTLWAHFLIFKVDNVYLIILKNLEIMHIKVPRPGTPHGFSKCNIISGKFCPILISCNLSVTVTWKPSLFKKSPVCKQFILWISSLIIGNEEKKERVKQLIEGKVCSNKILLCRIYTAVNLSNFICSNYVHNWALRAL